MGLQGATGLHCILIIGVVRHLFGGVWSEMALRSSQERAVGALRDFLVWGPPPGAVVVWRGSFVRTPAVRCGGLVGFFGAVGLAGFLGAFGR